MVIPQKTSNMFIGKAKQDGKIIGINDKLGLIKVEYKDGTQDIFEYGDIKGEASGMIINHRISPHPNVQIGAQFKQGNIITYHKDFFHLDPITKQVSWCHGIPTTMAMMPKDITLEDSNMISARLADKLKLTSIYTRTVQITSDMVIESFTDVGSYVKFNDPLIKLKYEDTADLIGDVDELFSDLRQIEYKSKYEGEIVDIQVFYVAEELNDSLTQFVNKITSNNRTKAKLAKGTLKEEHMTPVNRVPDGTRVKGVQLSNTDILILFNIRASISCGIGDKIVVGNMLKSVVGRIEHNPMMTEDGKEIDLCFGANSVFDRIVVSVFVNGISDTIIEEAEKDIVKMYFDE